MASEVAEKHVSLLRMLLSEEADGLESLFDGMGGDDDVPLSVLAACAVGIVARRHFKDGYTHADVVQYVAKMRTDDELGELQVRPVVTERLLRRALGQEVSVADQDPQAGAIGQWALLLSLTIDENLEGEKIDTLLAEAKDEANEALARHS